MTGMTVQDLAKLLATHISQGRAHHQVALHQWQHGYQDLTAIEARDASRVLELYSNTADAPPAPADDVEDLL